MPFQSLLTDLTKPLHRWTSYLNKIDEGKINHLREIKDKYLPGEFKK
ncbi:MAG: hypothetical protein HXY44_10780 [Syntrophaceae bacterium]|nr:hypothetical protein [Syntrophaceae bacterium]